MYLHFTPPIIFHRSVGVLGGGTRTRETLRFEILAAASLKINVFYYVALCVSKKLTDVSEVMM
jgi:hypothetical protein